MRIKFALTSKKNIEIFTLTVKRNEIQFKIRAEIWNLIYPPLGVTDLY